MDEMNSYVNRLRADAYGVIRQIEDNVQACTGWSRWKLSFLRAEQ